MVEDVLPVFLNARFAADGAADWAQTSWQRTRTVDTNDVEASRPRRDPPWIQESRRAGTAKPR